MAFVFKERYEAHIEERMRAFWHRCRNVIDGGSPPSKWRDWADYGLRTTDEQ